MKVTDYIVEFFISKNISDIFGYPGGVICHFMDSVSKYPNQINAHITYHEQAAAFAACGYAQETGKIGVAYSTSGPGATNLITGIANAYFDSTPAVFLTGQVDTYGLKGDLPIRQRGFQETDIVSMVEAVTKYAIRVDNPNDIKYELEKAYNIAVSGNPGPVLLDLPADVQRADVNIEELKEYFKAEDVFDEDGVISILKDAIYESNRPCLLVGNGVKQAGMKEILREIIEKINIPVVFSMPAFDTLPYNHKLNYGFIGANGHRYGNFVLGKSDLIISIGSRLCLKQVGNKRESFVPDAKLIRIDIDKGNFSYPVHTDEISLQCDIKSLLPKLKMALTDDFAVDKTWVNSCEYLKKKLEGYDNQPYTELIGEFGKNIPDNVVITADVGQSEVWLAQQLQVKENQSVHMSAGHGSMGYSLPAAIGAYYGRKTPVYSFNGDGGVQMNIQELQFLKRENIPVNVVIINNNALGMIRGFQEANFNKNYVQTIEGSGYSAPDFYEISKAYGLKYVLIKSVDDIKGFKELGDGPSIIEIKIQADTVLSPNFGANGLIQDARPYIDREIYDELMEA